MVAPPALALLGRGRHAGVAQGIYDQFVGR